MKASQKLQKEFDKLKKRVIGEIGAATEFKLDRRFDLSNVGSVTLSMDAEFSHMENFKVYIKFPQLKKLEEHSLEYFQTDDLIEILKTIENEK